MKCCRLFLVDVALSHCCRSSPRRRRRRPHDQPPPPAPNADPDARVDALQPDFNLAALPTTLRMPLHKLAFRVTHRFTRPLGEGDFGDLRVGLVRLRLGARRSVSSCGMACARGTQIGVHRTSDRTIQIFGQHNFLNERDGQADWASTRSRRSKAGTTCRSTTRARSAWWLRATSGASSRFTPSRSCREHQRCALDAGFDNNTADDWARRAGSAAAVDRTWSGKSRRGSRGYDPGANQVSFGLEGRAGGHLFQMNFSNGFGTTLGQIAGGTAELRQLVHRIQHRAQVFLTTHVRSVGGHRTMGTRILSRSDARDWIARDGRGVRRKLADIARRWRSAARLWSGPRVQSGRSAPQLRSARTAQSARHKSRSASGKA